MLSPLGNVLWAIVKWVLEHTVGLFTKSPLEEEFEEPEGGFTEAKLPDGRLLVKIQAGDLLADLGKVATRIDSGFGQEEISKTVERAVHLKPGRNVSFRYQVLHRGERSEFQVFLTKVDDSMCEILFQGTEPLIGELEALMDLAP